MDIKDVISDLGISYSELARRLGVTRSAVLQWGNKVPLSRQYQIKDLLAGKDPMGVEPYHTPESVMDGDEQ